MYWWINISCVEGLLRLLITKQSHSFSGIVKRACERIVFHHIILAPYSQRDNTEIHSVNYWVNYFNTDANKPVFLRK